MNFSNIQQRQPTSESQRLREDIGRTALLAMFVELPIAVVGVALAGPVMLIIPAAYLSMTFSRVRRQSASINNTRKAIQAKQGECCRDDARLAEERILVLTELEAAQACGDIRRMFAADMRCLAWEDRVRASPAMTRSPSNARGEDGLSKHYGNGALIALQRIGAPFLNTGKHKTLINKG